MTRDLHEAAMAAKRFHVAVLAYLDAPESLHRQSIMLGRRIELDVALEAIRPAAGVKG